MIIIDLQTLIDVIDLVRASSSEADWLEGVVLVGSGGHCRQPERNTKVHTLDDGLINTAVHSIKACLGCPWAFTLSATLFAAAFRRSFSAERAGQKRKKKGQQAGEARMIKPNEDIKPVMASQNCFRWSSHSA